VSQRPPLSGDFVDFLCKMRGIDRNAALELLREFVETRLLSRTPAKGVIEDDPNGELERKAK
jgi:hypothetical protein